MLRPQTKRPGLAASLPIGRRSGFHGYRSKDFVSPRRANILLAGMADEHPQRATAYLLLVIPATKRSGNRIEAGP